MTHAGCATHTAAHSDALLTTGNWSNCRSHMFGAVADDGC
eukprot:CAMPEP_0206322030 /NCGR_PEP_ID=MMETSP0106_2-20121207/19206_1 /ASSEMBLY_ACC=CAM_ASM_000206 /TAXON_ID=81532 /ORGANISM="Acanthoeca-like sp., Strain 10tr" /LENGTH=39 /DNA_ID= /DNA_START= /DNA_END= /DNA_ORIENTATION=